MDLEKTWRKAVEGTQIEKSWIGYLNTYSSTVLPYIVLSKSLVDDSDTVVRKGKIEVSRPLIYLPDHTPIFEGFEFEKNEISENSLLTFLLIRGISFPSMKYSNVIYSLDIENLNLDETIKKYKQELERLEDVHTGLIVGPDDCWQFSLLIYVAALTAKSAPHDIKKFLEDLKRKFKDKGKP